MQDDLDLSSQAEGQAERSKQSKAEAQREIDDIVWLMSERTGRRIVYGLLAKAGVYTSSFTGDTETFFREGKRVIGLAYLAIVNAHCPDQFVLMLKEHSENAG